MGLWCYFTVFQKLKSSSNYFHREIILSIRHSKDESLGHKFKAIIVIMQNILSKYLICIFNRNGLNFYR